MKKRVLIVIENALDIGGVQNVVMCMVRNLYTEIDFDIVVSNKNKGYYDEEFLSYGKIYVFERRKKAGIFKYIKDEKTIEKQIKNLLSKEKYDAIYCANMFNAGVFLKMAKKAKVPIRIAHSQVAGEKKIKFYSKILNAIKRKKIVKNATHFLAVTQNSADYLFGKNNKAIVAKNPIFSVSEYLNIENNCCDNEIRLLHLANMNFRKNQMFSVEVLEELIKLDNRFRLTIAGNGDNDYIENLRQTILSKKLEEFINLVPTFVNDKEEFSKHNYIILPSINEGLPCVLLQGQAVGLKCFVSDYIERICDQGLCSFLPLEKGAKYWAEEIYKYYIENGAERKNIDMTEWDAQIICSKYRNLFEGNGFN